MACLISCPSIIHPTLSLFFLLISLHSLSPSTLMTANADEGLIQRTCQNTPHHDLCVTAMKANHSSQEADVTGLALIVVKVAMYSANLTYSQLGSFRRGATDESSFEVCGLCENLYGAVAGAGMFLRLAAGRLEKHKEYRFAYNDVNITKEYVGWCHEEFLEHDVFYPPLLSKGEVELVQLCEIAMAIIGVLF